MKTSQRGWTLVEALISLAVTAIALGAAVPGFQEARERRHLEGAAAQLETDLQFARSLAVARNQAVRMTFERSAEASCYVVHTGDAGDCSCATDGSAVCTAGAEPLRSMRYDAQVPFHLLSNSRSIQFDPVRGTVTPTATVRVLATSGAAIHQVVNIMGRVRSCSPAPALVGYRPC